MTHPGFSLIVRGERKFYCSKCAVLKTAKGAKGAFSGVCCICDKPFGTEPKKPALTARPEPPPPQPEARYYTKEKPVGGNTLNDVADHLMAQMERLSGVADDDKAMAREVKRSTSLIGVANSVVDTRRLQFEAWKAAQGLTGADQLPPQQILTPALPPARRGPALRLEEPVDGG